MQANIPELLSEASTLMIVGMGVVFVFLTLMIGAVNLIACINRKLPEESLPNHSPTTRRATAKSPGDNDIPVAAIAAAIHQYRKKQ